MMLVRHCRRHCFLTALKAAQYDFVELSDALYEAAENTYRYKRHYDS